MQRWCQAGRMAVAAAAIAFTARDGRAQVGGLESGERVPLPSAAPAWAVAVDSVMRVINDQILDGTASSTRLTNGITSWGTAIGGDSVYVAERVAADSTRDAAYFDVDGRPFLLIEYVPNTARGPVRSFSYFTREGGLAYAFTDRDGPLSSADLAGAAPEYARTAGALNPVGSGFPALPLTVTYRRSLVGNGLVAQFRNASSSPLSLSARFSNTVTAESRLFRVTVPPHGVAEFGHMEGWAFARGHTIDLTAAGFRPLEIVVP